MINKYHRIIVSGIYISFSDTRNYVQQYTSYNSRERLSNFIKQNTPDDLWIGKTDVTYTYGLYFGLKDIK